MHRQQYQENSRALPILLVVLFFAFAISTALGVKKTNASEIVFHFKHAQPCTCTVTDGSGNVLFTKSRDAFEYVNSVPLFHRSFYKGKRTDALYYEFFDENGESLGTAEFNGEGFSYCGMFYKAGRS